MNDMTKHVPPSGDTTGQADRIAVQACIDEMERTVPLGCHGRLTLGGKYFFDYPGIRLGTKSTPTLVVIGGEGSATTEAVGAWQDGYAVSIYGARYGANTAASGLRIDGANRCGGLYCDSVATKSALRDIEIRRTNGTALRLNNCWGMSLYNVWINECVGAAVVTRWLNAAHVDSMSVTNCKATTGPLIVIDGLGSVFTNMHMEANNCGEQPLLYAKNEQDNSHVAASLRFVSQYHEGNRCTRQAILLESAKFIVMDGISVMSHPDIQDECECLIRCVNGSRGVRVSGVTGYPMIKRGGAIVLADKGKHFGITCEHSAASNSWGSVEMKDWMQARNGATLHPWAKEY